MLTLTEKLETIAAEYQNHIIMRAQQGDTYTHHTYTDFLIRAKNAANYFIANDIKPCDKIAIVLENRPEWGMAYFGILFAGAIAVPLDPQASSADLKYFFSDSGSKMIITSDKYAVMLSSIAAENFLQPQIAVLENSNIFQFKNPIAITLPKLHPENIASILYTSGTTGRPKGIMLTHRNFYSNFESITHININFYNKNILAILPLHHSFPFTTTLLLPLFSHCKIIYPKNLTSDVLLRCAQENDVSIMMAVPQFFNLFYKKLISSINTVNFFTKIFFKLLLALNWFLRKYCKLNLGKFLFKKIHANFGKNFHYFVSGGAKLDIDIGKFFLKLGFNIIEGYGLSETSPIVTINLNKIQKPNSVGCAIQNVAIKINNPDTNSIGEILVQGPNVMLGYYNMPDATAEALRNNWFFTGDLGYLDKDRYLYITGRKKEMIVLSSGKNVSPEEVEKYYSQTPLIKEMCVLEVTQNMEEKLMAIIAPDLEYCRANNIIDISGSLKWEIENLSKKFPAYKRIMGFIVTTDKFPRTRLGKLQRFLIKDRYTPELLGIKTAPQISEEITEENANDAIFLANPMAQKIITLLQETTKIEKKINLNDHLEIDLGIDSLNRVELAVPLEKLTNKKISEATFSKIATVKELILAFLSSQEKLQLTANITAPPLPSWQSILSEELSENLLKQIELKNTGLEKISLRITVSVFTQCFNLLWRTKLIGVENLPKNQPFILCPNHCSYLDGFIIYVGMPNWLKAKLFFLGQKNFFDVPIIKSLTKFLRIIPIDPALQLVNAMQACAYVLHSGNPLCIFPEGARSIDGEVKEFKKGIGILAQELNIPLVPVYIDGSFVAWSRSKHFPKPHKIRVICGKSCTTDELLTIGKILGAKDDYEAIAKGIREKVINLKIKNT